MCQSCPLFSNTTESDTAVAVCPCDSGYYRPLDGSEDASPCTREYAHRHRYYTLARTYHTHMHTLTHTHTCMLMHALTHACTRTHTHTHTHTRTHTHARTRSSLLLLLSTAIKVTWSSYSSMKKLKMPTQQFCTCEQIVLLCYETSGNITNIEQLLVVPQLAVIFLPDTCVTSDH